MRKIILSALTLIAISLQSNATLSVFSNVMIEENRSQVMDLSNIQDKILSDFMNSFIEQNNDKLTGRIEQLAISHKATDNPLYLYWKGYALFHNCIIYLKNSDRAQANKELNRAIEADRKSVV